MVGVVDGWVGVFWGGWCLRWGFLGWLMVGIRFFRLVGCWGGVVLVWLVVGVGGSCG